MSVVDFQMFSRELFRSVSVRVTLPTPDSGDSFFGTKTNYPEKEQKYQVLWLLHGFTADHTDWTRFSSIERYAQKKQLAVVMPDCYNSFYADNPSGGNYYSYYVDELPHMLRSLLPLSAKREHNFIAGLSMGGYGAFKAAFRNPEKYAAAASLSGGLTVTDPEKTGRPSPVGTMVERWKRGIYGSGSEFYDPEKEDLQILLKNCVQAKTDLPRLYECCGTEDFVYPGNTEFRDYALGLGVDLTYEEGPGIHNFDFWDTYIKKILDWLPLAAGFVD